MTTRRLSWELLAALVEEAAQSSRRRQHLNIHWDYADPCQRLLNAIGVDSYIRPHRHALDPKAECLVAVRGLFALVTFDEDGSIREVVRFGTEGHGPAEVLAVGVELSAGTWHTVIALVPGAVLLELKAGPFDPNAAKEPASWAPEEGSPHATLYLEGLRAAIIG